MSPRYMLASPHCTEILLPDSSESATSLQEGTVDWEELVVQHTAERHKVENSDGAGEKKKKRPPGTLKR